MIAVRTVEFIYMWPDGVSITKEKIDGLDDWRAEGPDGVEVIPLMTLQLAEFKQLSPRTPLPRKNSKVEYQNFALVRRKPCG